MILFSFSAPQAGARPRVGHVRLVTFKDTPACGLLKTTVQASNRRQPTEPGVKMVKATLPAGKSTLLRVRIAPGRWGRRQLSSVDRTVRTKPAVVPAVNPPPPSPLAGLPTSVLLQSLIVATVSSKHYILLPALLVLNFLCKICKSRLFNVDRNPILHTILKSTIYKQ